MLGLSDFGSFGGNGMASSHWYPSPAGSSTSSGESFGYVMESTPRYDCKPSNSRELRNRAEKMRRDKMNNFIGDLSRSVSKQIQTGKKLDKTSILRLTATVLRIYNMVEHYRCSPANKIPKSVEIDRLEEIMCDHLGGFLMVLTSSGKIVFVSKAVEKYLGHLQVDLFGLSIFDLTPLEDHAKMRVYFDPAHFIERDFTTKFKRAGPRTESPVYQRVNITGKHLKLLSCTNTRNRNQNFNITNSTNDLSQFQTGNASNSDVLLFLVKLDRPDTIQDKLLQFTTEEYVTRHLLDGRIINCDYRISLIAGYMTEEVSGVPAFMFMHKQEVRWVMVALRQMYDKRESRGSSCYRLLARNGEFIYLRTHGYLEIDTSGTVESFVCVNRLIDKAEGEKLIREMKRKYSPLIKSQSFPFIQNLENDAVDETVEDPEEVEAAMKHLITNLPVPSHLAALPRLEPRRVGSSCSQEQHNESQDCSNSSDSSQVKLNRVAKMASKRPPSADPESLINKRPKFSPQFSPVSVLSPKRPAIIDEICKVKLVNPYKHKQQCFEH